MTPAIKNAVFALDLEQTRRHAHRALVSIKEPSARSEEPLNVGTDLLASSRGQIPNAGDRVMYHVSFFKTLLSSDGHPLKCLQRRIDISDAESAEQAVESASRAFEALYGCTWKLHADTIEVTLPTPNSKDARNV